MRRSSAATRSASVASGSLNTSVSDVPTCSVAGRRTVTIASRAQERAQLRPPFPCGLALLVEARQLVEPREHRVELTAIDPLAGVRTDGDRLVEPAVGQRVVLATNPQAAVDQPFDAHHVPPDLVQLRRIELQAG